MPRVNGEKKKIDDGEDEDREAPVSVKDGCGEDEDDDDEANEDLSLKILEKALSRRDFDDSKDTSMSDLCGSGVVGTVSVNGGKSNGESSKKMRRTKPEAAHEISERDEEKDALKGEEDERCAEPSNNMVLKKLLRGARYFDPPDAGWVSCYSCGEQGHITVNCPTPTKRRKPCFICGSLEHGAKQCSKGQDCYICKKGGHRAKDCPDKYKGGSKTGVCLRCGGFGHEMILCKYEYSQDDLKDIQCYVCKSFGHLCCVEPGGNSPLWAVSCYRCGQPGHTGLACGRHYDESPEKDSVSSSCFKCGGEGHLKRDCPNSSSVSCKELASACFNCGEEGHFSRECPNSSSISISQPKGRGDSPSLCYRCDGAGHFARECPNSSQVSCKRNRETPTPSRKSRKRNEENSEHNFESNGKTKKKKSHKAQEPKTTPRKPKHRGGWVPEEEDYCQVRRPITPMAHNHHRFPTFNSGGHFQSSYGRNRRNEYSPSRWQPPNSHHQHLRPSRYGPAHHPGDYFAWDHGR